MKRILALLGLIILIVTICGCQASTPQAQIAATTLPVYEFTSRLCQNTDISVTRVITDTVSCLHDYSLSVKQVRAIEGASLVILSGAGLEHFMEDVLKHAPAVVDSSKGIPLFTCEDSHEHEHHAHEADPHIWLSPANAKAMATNIYEGLCIQFPKAKDRFDTNLQALLDELDKLENYGKQTLSQLSCRELITFHDGFSYLAEAFDLKILKAVEEEAGAEASAQELKALITLVNEHKLSAIFTERNGSVSAANIIAAETGVKIFTLDMVMTGQSYFQAMYHNIDTLKEALQ